MFSFPSIVREMDVKYLAAQKFACPVWREGDCGAGAGEGEAQGEGAAACVCV